MTDPLLDDVKALLDKDFGDDRILKQICRACENNEVISNYERNYVRKLAEKHLGKKPAFTQSPPVEEKHVVPDVILPEIKPIPQTQSFQTVPQTSYSKPKSKKIIFGIGSFALVVVVAVAISFSGITDGNFKTDTVTNGASISLSVQTDLKSYNNKDLISISEVSAPAGNVNLSIENQKNELVWAEQVSLKSNGQFSTLAIAGGPGWENSGTYTIKVDNGKETKSDTFSFTS